MAHRSIRATESSPGSSPRIVAVGLVHPEAAEVLTRCLASIPFTFFTDRHDMYTHLLHEHADLVILDTSIPDTENAEFQSCLKTVFPSLPVKFLPAGGTEHWSAWAAGLADRLHDRPPTAEFQTAELLSAARRMAERGYRSESIRETLRIFQESLSRSIPCLASAMVRAGEDAPRVFMEASAPLSPARVRAILERAVACARELGGSGWPGPEDYEVLAEDIVEEDDGDDAPGDYIAIPAVFEEAFRGLLVIAAPPQTQFQPAHHAAIRPYAACFLNVVSALEKMQEHAVHDPLTGLLNRRGMQREVLRAWQFAERYRQPVGVVSIDIDHFKSVNDSFGHPVGDAVLREVATLLSGAIRVTDLLGRFGGDELVLFLPHTGPEDTRLLGDRLRNLLRNHTFCEKVADVNITASFGIASCEPAGKRLSHSDFMRRADQALYMAKARGRDRIVEWDNADDPASDRPGGSGHPAGPGADDARLRNRSGREPGTVLVVDDEDMVARLLERMLQQEGHHVMTAGTSREALAAARQPGTAVDVAMIDINLAGESGLDLMAKLQDVDEHIVNIIITGQATVDNAIASVRGGAYDFIEKPFASEHLLSTVRRAMEFRRLLKENLHYQLHLEEMVRARSADLSRALHQVRDSYSFTLEALSALLDAREHATGQHSVRVSSMARLLAETMGLPGKMVDEVEHGALLHDIGKIGIPDAILLKPGALDENEWIIMKTHPEIGYRILNARPYLEQVARIVYEHQERYDGSGYPQGLKGNRICLGARIFAVVDSYDAIRSERPYAPARPAEVAVEEIRRLSGIAYDPDVVQAFLQRWKDLERIGMWDEAGPAQG